MDEYQDILRCCVSYPGNDLRLGGNAMQSQGYATEATDIVISVIVYLAAFALLLRMLLSGKLGKRRNKNGKKEAAAK